MIAAFAAACAQSSSNENPAAKPAATEKADHAASKPADEAAHAASKPAMAAGDDLPPAPARGDDSGRKSKNGSLEATIGGVRVAVHYGRPQARGREVFGKLIPFDKVWRTGADEATTISFSKDAMFAGQKVARGTYALFTIPGEKSWTVLLNSDPKQWGAYKRDSAKNVVTQKVSATKHDATEALTFAATNDALQLMWDDVAVSIPVAAAE